MRHRIKSNMELSEICFDDDEESTLKIRIIKLIDKQLPEDVTITLLRRPTIKALEAIVERMKQVK